MLAGLHNSGKRNTNEFKELLAAFAAKFGIEGLGGADGGAELEVNGIRVELLEDPPTRSLVACAEIGLPPPDANGAFGSMMLKANFLLRANQTENWRKALTGLREAESAQSAAQKVDDSHHDMLSSGFSMCNLFLFRVYTG